jgi:hypothetical protein
MQSLKALFGYIWNFLLLIIFSKKKKSITKQSRCINSECPHFISVKALKYEREKCKFCREKDGSLKRRCEFQYNDGMKCHESNDQYHYHCSEANCNGAVYCSLCMQCPNCNPCH